MNEYENGDVQPQIFLTLALDGIECLASRPVQFIHGERALVIY
jgi:hypothetical protein